MKILVTGGGSGGHASPAVAVAAQYIKKGHKVSYIGSYSGIERKLAKEIGAKYHPISTGKLRRYLSIKNLTDPVRVMRGYFQAKKIMKKEKIDLVFAAGGFVSMPVGLAAHRLKIPLVLNEADLKLGLTNKILGKYADKICLAFPEAAKFFAKNKTEVTGLPLQQKVLQGNKNRAKKVFNPPKNKPVLLVLGGSQGALFLNQLIATSLDELTKKYFVIHLTGKDKSASPSQKNYIPLEYVSSETMADLYALADFAITRAGANTLFELAAWQIPGTIVPLPSAAADHQTKNAKYFVKNGGYTLLPQKKADKKSLLKIINTKFSTADKRKNLQKKIKLSAKDGLKNVVKVIEKVFSKFKRN